MSRLLDSVRRLQRRTILGFWLLVGIAAVAIALPGRWNGGYDAHSGVHYVPLRPLTPIEAASLIACRTKYSQTAITKLTDTSVYINTGIYVLPAGPRAQSSGLARCENDETYAVGKEAWEWGVAHVVDRVPLERALGRRLTQQDVGSRPNQWTTYASRLWWLFAMGDALFLAVFGTLLTLVLRRLQRPASLFAVPAILVGFCFAWVVALEFYSPVLLGSPRYHQRVLVENGPWEWASAASQLLPYWIAGMDPVVIAGASLVVYGLCVIRRRIPALRAIAPMPYWGALGAICAIAAGAIATDAHRAFLRDRDHSRQILARVRSIFPSVGPTIAEDRIVRLMSPIDIQTARDAAGRPVESNLLKAGVLQPATQDAIHRLVDGTPPDVLLSVYVPGKPGVFALMTGHPRGQLMDMRVLREFVGRDNFVEDGNASLVERMLSSGGDFSQSFRGYLLREHEEGIVLRGPDGAIAAIAIARVIDATGPAGRRVAHAILGFQSEYYEWN